MLDFTLKLIGIKRKCQRDV